MEKTRTETITTTSKTKTKTAAKTSSGKTDTGKTDIGKTDIGKTGAAKDATAKATSKATPIVTPQATSKVTPNKSNESESLLLGKDEMNLVEHPFAILKHGSQDRNVIRQSFEKVHPRTGKTVKSLWEVTGHSEQGLPGPTEERLYVALMQITREQSPREKTIYFSRGDLMNRLGWSHTKQYYEALATAFTRLAAVTIRADRAFWDAAREDFYATVTFHVLEEVHISNEPPGRRAQNALPLSSFSWGDTIFQSLQAGYLRSLDTDFALSLNLPLSLRLFRYLDKHRRGKGRAERQSFSIGLKRLCEIHLGMAPSKYNSKHKERLKPAHEELMARGFLASYDFAPMKTKDGEKVTYHFAAPPELPAATPDAANKEATDDPPTLFPDAFGDAFSGDAFTSAEDIENFQPALEIELQLREAEMWEDAANEVFESLPPEVHDDLWKRAIEPLPLMFRENPKMPGAQRSIRRQIGDLMRYEHEEEVKNYLRQKIQNEQTSNKAKRPKS
ncbi:MAG TPA: replication initiator protein A [Abditibacteriaceae bacterium]